jgi:phosphoadenosine phosphosulfate reductase
MDSKLGPSRVDRDEAWTPERLERIDARLRHASPDAVLRWGIESFGQDLCLATSFGPQSIVLMHQVSVLCPQMTVFYLDTELLFPETYSLRDRLADLLGLQFTRLTAELSVEDQASRHGPRLWSRDPDLCCHLRKVLPLRRFLSTKKAWITGIRSGHTAHRANGHIVHWDAPNAVVKLNPLLNWTHEQVWGYLRTHGLPYNRLHDEGFPSIGCQPCTRAVAPGDDPRSGRWPGFEKSECGIHFPSGTSHRDIVEENLS